MLLTSVLLILGTLAVLFANIAYSGGEPAIGFQQLVHARIPWLILATLWIGTGLGIYSLVRAHRWIKYLVVVPELALTVLLSHYFLQVSWLPAHELKLQVGDPFPSYSLLDQDEQRRTVQASAPRSSALYIFYRGDW